MSTNSTFIAQKARVGTELPDSTPRQLYRLTPDEALDMAPDFADLIALWTGRRGSAAVPDWRDMSFEDFRGWHSWLALGQFECDEPDPLFRLVGQGLIETLKFSMKGLRFSEIHPLLYERQFRAHFGEIRARGLIGFGIGRVAFKGREHLTTRIMELPFRDGGPRVDRLVHAVSVR